ncbi:MAG: radical SAM protein [Alcaligenaceae bacterium]|nr:radical SAM protein [Alcaligenaceae bacterium]
MNYVLNQGFRLGVRPTRGHGDVHFVTREDVDGRTLVLDEHSSALIEILLRDQPYEPDAADVEVLERLVLEGIVSKTNAKKSPPQFQAENLQFWVQTSDRCNLACTYCYIPSLNSAKARRSDLFSLFGRKLLGVKGLKSVSIKLAGGEPLLSFQDWCAEVIKLRETLAEADIRLNARIITNLTFLNRSIVEYIRANDIGVSVSLDGLSANNDRNRVFPVSGHGSFHIVKKNLKVLRESGIKPGVMITATSENSAGIHELVESLVKEDLIFRFSDAKGGHIRPREFEIAFADVKQTLARAVAAGYPVSKRIVVSDLRTLEPQTTPCSMGTTGGALYLDGSVYFCHTEFEKGSPLGSLDEDVGLLDIIRRGYKKHLGLSMDCRACEYRFVCAGGCPLFRVNGKSPMCSAYKKIIPQIFDLYDEESARV